MIIHRFKHLFHGILIFRFFVLNFPNFSKASLSDNVEIVEYIFLYFDVLYVKLVQIKLHDFMKFLMTINGFFFCFLRD